MRWRPARTIVRKETNMNMLRVKLALALALVLFLALSVAAQEELERASPDEIDTDGVREEEEGEEEYGLLDEDGSFYYDEETLLSGQEANEDSGVMARRLVNIKSLTKLCLSTSEGMEVTTGSVDSDQVNGLEEIDMSGTSDANYAGYVEAQLSAKNLFSGDVVFNIPTTVDVTKVKVIGATVRFRGDKGITKKKQNLWTVRYAKLNKKKYYSVWDNSATTAWVWTTTSKYVKVKGNFKLYVNSNREFRLNVATAKAVTENGLFDYVGLCLYMAKGWYIEQPTTSPTNSPTQVPISSPTAAPTTPAPTQVRVPDGLATSCFVPYNMSIEKGYIGADQTVDGLAQRNTFNNEVTQPWLKIVEFHPSSTEAGATFYFYYNVTQLTDIYSAQFKWNFRGQTTEYQLWKVGLYNYNTGTYGCLAQTPNKAKSWKWLYNVGSYIVKSNGKYVDDDGIAIVRYSTDTSVDASQLDFAKLCFQRLV